MNYEIDNFDVVDSWREIRAGYAKQFLADSLAAEQQLLCRMRVQSTPELLQQLDFCRKSIVAARETLEALKCG